jgi:hypothetical protein
MNLCSNAAECLELAMLRIEVVSIYHVVRQYNESISFISALKPAVQAIS